MACSRRSRRPRTRRTSRRRSAPTGCGASTTTIRSQPGPLARGDALVLRRPGPRARRSPALTLRRPEHRLGAARQGGHAAARPTRADRACGRWAGSSNRWPARSFASASSQARSTCSPARRPEREQARRAARGVRRVRAHRGPRGARASGRRRARGAHRRHARRCRPGRLGRCCRFMPREIDERQPPRRASPARCARAPPRRRGPLLAGGSAPPAAFEAAVHAPAPTAVAAALGRRRPAGVASAARAVGRDRRPHGARARARATAGSRTPSRCSAPATRSRSTCRSRSRPRSWPRRGTCASSARRASAASHPMSSGASCCGRGCAREPPARPDDAGAGRRLPAGRRRGDRGRIIRRGRGRSSSVLVEHEDGVIAVHAPYFHALERPLRQRLDALRTPLVVALPAGMTPEQAEDRRERLLQMLRQAVGYEITFGDERGPMTTSSTAARGDRAAGRSGASPARSWSRAASTACGCTTSCASARRRCPAR